MYPEKITLFFFTPNHADFSSGYTFRPLGVFPFTVLLMEEKWSRFAGSLTTKLSWWFGHVSIWTSQKQLYFLTIRGLKKAPCGQQRDDTMFDGFKRRAQRKNYQKGESKVLKSCSFYFWTVFALYWPFGNVKLTMKQIDAQRRLLSMKRNA